MKLHWKHWESGRSGTIAVTPEDADDIWALCNVIAAGDEVEAVTMRRVIQESNGGSSKSDSHKVKMWLLVRVEKVDVDLRAASLRLNGRNIRENEHVKMGSYHTLDIEPDRKVKIRKEHWSSLDLEILDQASSAMGKSEVAAVVIELGAAMFCSVKDSGEVRVLERVECALPKKKLGATSKAESVADKFYSSAMDKLRQVFGVAKLKAIVIAGPGDAKDEFYKRLVEAAVKAEDKELLANKSKFIRLPLSNAQPAALKEILKEPRVAALLADTKGAQEGKSLDGLFKCLHDETGLAVFGISQVEKAAEQGAVKTLLLSDSLFRSSELATRKRYAQLVDSVKKNSGGACQIFSGGSETDQRLMQVTGVAALLTFPIFED